MEGFEPPDGLTRQLISSQPRYDHFDTSPYKLILYHKHRKKQGGGGENYPECRRRFFRRKGLLNLAEQVIYLETGSVDPAYNLAFEETVLTGRREGDYLLLWQNDNTVVIGQNQNAEAEIHRGFVEEHGIRVVRRATGGGAVYHDLGNLNYSFITAAGDAERLTMERFTRPVVEALRGLGLDAEASGRNDILVSGRKVSGTAQRLSRGRILHHGTLLFDANPAMVAGALNADPEKFRSKSTKSVRSRVGNIRDFLPEDMDLPAFWAYLKEALSPAGLTPGALTAEELAAVEQLRQEKYANWEWTYGRSPKYGMTNKRRWSGGTLEVHLEVKQGRVEDILFYGDFLSLRPLDELLAALRGCPFRKADFAAVLERFPLGELLGTITAEEVLETVFYVADKT